MLSHVNKIYSFDDAAFKYTTAITSCKRLIEDIESHGGGGKSLTHVGKCPSNGGKCPSDSSAGEAEREQLAELYRARAKAHINNGMYRTAVEDCNVASESAQQVDVWQKARVHPVGILDVPISVCCVLK